MRRLIPISVVLLGAWLVSGLGGFTPSRSPVVAVPVTPSSGGSAGAAMLDRLTSDGFPREW